VKVPVENLLGKEGKGLFVVLSNFKCVFPSFSPFSFFPLLNFPFTPSHERWVMCCGSVAGSRLAVEEVRHTPFTFFSPFSPFPLATSVSSGLTSARPSESPSSTSPLFVPRYVVAVLALLAKLIRLFLLFFRRFLPQLAAMISKVEALQASLENITYQMCAMSYAEQADKLAGPIGLLKYVRRLLFL
jgi:hypothetical protein